MASDAFTGTNGDPLSASWTGIDATYTKDNTEIYNNCAAMDDDAIWDVYAGVYHSSSADECQAVIKGTAAAGAWQRRQIAVRAGADQRGYSVSLRATSGTVIDFANVQKNGVDLAVRSGFTGFECSLDATLKIKCSGTTTVTIQVFLGDVQIGADITDASSPLSAGHPAIWWGNNIASQANSMIDDWTDNASAGGVSKPIAMHHYRAMRMA